MNSFLGFFVGAWQVVASIFGFGHVTPQVAVDSNVLTQASVTIEQSAAPVGYVTLSGTANVSLLSMDIKAADGSVAYANGSRNPIVVTNGHWSAYVGNLQTPGQYAVHVYSYDPYKLLLTTTLTITEDQLIQFTASPSSGVAPLAVHFVSNKYATQDASEPQHYVDFGDKTELGRITCTKSSGTDLGSYRCLEWGVDHLYSSSGTYTTSLVEVAPCLGTTCSGTRPEKTLKTIAVTVSQGNGTAVSVSGISKYTDTDFGFSFWYPSGSQVTSDSAAKNSDSQYGEGTQIKKTINAPAFTISEVYSPGAKILGDMMNDPSPLSSTFYFFFDKDSHQWMEFSDGGPCACGPSGNFPADVSKNTMGGLHIFYGYTRFGIKLIIPLSAHNFLVLIANCDAAEATDCGFATDPHSRLNRFNTSVQTIVATDPSVATPVSAGDQTAAIQAEARAYGVSSVGSTDVSKVFSAAVYPFKLSYPSDFTLAKDITASQKNRTLAYMSVTCDDSSVCLYYTGSEITDTQAAALSVRVSNKPTYEECMKVAINPTDTVTIQGISWLKDATGDAGLGNRLSSDRYRTYYNGLCYQAELSIGWNIGTKDSSLQTLDQKMQSIMNSFQFTVPQTVAATHSGATSEWKILVGTPIPISFKYPGSFIVEENDARGIGVARGSYVGVGWQPSDDYGGQISIQPDSMFASVQDAGQRSQYRRPDGSNGSSITVGGQPAYQFRDSTGTYALYIMIAGKLYQITMFGDINSPEIPNEWGTFINSFAFTD